MPLQSTTVHYSAKLSSHCDIYINIKATLLKSIEHFIVMAMVSNLCHIGKSNQSAMSTLMMMMSRIVT